MSPEHSPSITPPPLLRGIELAYVPEVLDQVQAGTPPLRCDVPQKLSTANSVKVYVFVTPNAWWHTTAPLENGLYSLLNHHSLRNSTRWPTSRYKIYDVHQSEWLDLPTFAKIEVHDQEFLMLRSAHDADSSEFDSLGHGGMDSLMVEARERYEQATERQRLPPLLRAKRNTRVDTPGPRRRRAVVLVPDSDSDSSRTVVPSPAKRLRFSDSSSRDNSSPSSSRPLTRAAAKRFRLPDISSRDGDSSPSSSSPLTRAAAKRRARPFPVFA